MLSLADVWVEEGEDLADCFLVDSARFLVKPRSEVAVSLIVTLSAGKAGLVHGVGVRASVHIQRLKALKKMRANTLGHNGIG